METGLSSTKNKKQTTVLSFFVKKKKDPPTANLTMPDQNTYSSTFSHVSAPMTTDGNGPTVVTELVSMIVHPSHLILILAKGLCLIFGIHNFK